MRLKICNKKKKIYSFDEQDCKEYNLKYNTQFFFKSTRNKNTFVNDMYFVGVDKNRYKYIDELYMYLTSNSLKPLFQIIPDNNKQYENKLIICERFVEYDEVLRNVSVSKALLDIGKPGQIGMTYRAMEALFYDKKIVTNNIHYRNLPFYSPNKIYIITDNSFNGLAEFINSPSIKYSDKVKQYYNIKNWIGRFNE